MLSPRELETIAKSMGSMMSEQIKPLIKHIAALEGQVKSLQDELAAHPDINFLVGEAVKALPVPKDGTSVTVEDVAPMLQELVSKAVGELPAPKDGASVTVEDVTPMLQELVSKAVGELPAPKDGASVTVEDVAPMLQELVSKVKDGRDATQLDILPGIELDQTYLRGAYATHDGGLWRAHSTTKGMRGWECIVDGVKEVVVDQVDERRSTISVIMASGKTVAREMVVPALIERGVYRSDKEDYEKGDMVTFGGSGWVALVDKPTGKPGTNEKEWRLFVKKGRDAKEATYVIDRSAPVKL